MASANKRTREELVSGGYCPNCSKCTGQTGDGIEGSMSYGCRKCGTLLLEVRVSPYDDTSQFIDVTNHWQEIRDWYNTRREEIDSRISELEMQLFREVPQVVAEIVGGAKTDSRQFKGLTLVNRADERSKEGQTRTDEEWRRKRLEVRGLPGISYEGEDVLQQLLTWAWRRADRWVPASCSRPTVGGRAIMSLDEHWSPHIDSLVKLGRITPKIVDGQAGWIVPSTKDWRSAVRDKRRANEQGNN